MGRKTRLTEDLIDDICIWVAANNRPVVAAAKAGVPERTFYEWKKKGAEQEEGIYREFVDRLDRSLAEGEATAVGIIKIAAGGNSDLKIKPQWQAAAWLLERRMPNEYGQRPRSQNIGATKEQEQLDHQAWRRRRLAEIRARKDAEQLESKT